MDPDIERLSRFYERFNARDIDGVPDGLARDVIWANGMDSPAMPTAGKASAPTSRRSGRAPR